MDRPRYLPPRRVRVLTVSEGERTSTVMVGPVRGPDHLALIHRLEYYHVPVSAIAASRAAVQFVAFYEGATRFRGKLGVIREYAEVVRVSTVPRCDLPGLTWPGRRGETAAYYRFDLGPIRLLPVPITNPDRLRIAFRFPDLQRLQQVATLRDLGGAQASPDRPETPPRGSRCPRRRKPGPCGAA